MPISYVNQPATIYIENMLRLRKYDKKHDFALEWYQNIETVYLVDGKTTSYDLEQLNRMYSYLDSKGELYFIEVFESDEWKPIGDVTFCKEDMPIVIGDENYRGKGIGGKVIQALIQRGKELGYDSLFVSEIYDWNIGSQKCFESAGFTKYKKTDKGYSYRYSFSIYDQDEFFESYAQMSRSQYGLESAGEWHQLQPLFPDVTNQKVLDLGCGYGWHAKYAVEHGAGKVIAIDASQKMLKEAMKRNNHPNIHYKHMDLYTYDYPESAYDLIISNLVLHYVENLKDIYQRIHQTLKPDGIFLLNIEHPTFTAGVHQQFITNQNNHALYWPVDNYYYPGLRTTNFLNHTVTKYHHTLTQILQGLIETGFELIHIEEVQPSEEMIHLPGMKDEMRRPMMLLIKARKKC